MVRGLDRIIQSGRTLTITMKSTFCPLAGREHTGNHSYLVLSPKGIRACCHSDKPRNEACRKGGDLIPTKDLPPEIVEVIPAPPPTFEDPAKNTAFERSFNGTDRDVAEFASFLVPNFACINLKNTEESWWECTNGRWHNDNAANRLFHTLNDLPLLYEEAAAKIDDKEERKNVERVARSCSDYNFIQKVVKRMAHIKQDTQFEILLDSKTHLLGFDDGTVTKQPPRMPARFLLFWYVALLHPSGRCSFSPAQDVPL